MNSKPNKPNLEISDGVVNVPSFPCIVYVAAKETGGIRARVGNLDGIEVEGASERDALGKIVPVFKKRVSELMSAGTPIPWIDPPSEMRTGEQKRFLPVHL